MMASKHKPASRKEPQAKRVVTEISPGVRVMLDAYMNAYNHGAERVSSPLKYTDVINQALDAFLPGKPGPDKESDHAEGKEAGKGPEGQGA
jgi:hypothetical protein